MLVYYFVPFIVSNRYLLFWVSNGHNPVTVQNRTHVYMNFFDHKDLGNHPLQLCPKVVKHPVYKISCATQEDFEWKGFINADKTGVYFLHTKIILSVTFRYVSCNNTGETSQQHQSTEKTTSPQTIHQ